MAIAQAIIDIVMNIIITMSIVTLAIDIMRWTFDANRTEFGTYTGSFMEGMITQIVGMPIKFVAAVIVLIFKVVEAVVRTVVGLISSKVAEKITFVDVNLKDLM